MYCRFPKLYDGIQSEQNKPMFKYLNVLLIYLQIAHWCRDVRFYTNLFVFMLKIK